MKHEIKRDPRGNTTVTDLTMESVDPNDAAGVDEIMQVCVCVCTNMGTAVRRVNQSAASLLLVVSFSPLPRMRVSF